MKKLYSSLLILGLVLVGCSGEANNRESIALPEESVPLVTPYHTAAPVQTQAPTPTPTSTPTPPPLPTPTPFIHIVADGETMIGIAAYYGISLDELGVANPEVNPNFLSVGAQLVIPLELEEGETASPAEPDLQPVTAGEVSCLPDQGGGMWCFWPVTNSLAQPVENLTGLVYLYDRAGELLLSQPAYSLVNLLKPGETVALGTYFKPPLPDWQAAQAQITSAAAANQAEVRYLETAVSGLTIQTQGDGLEAEVSGTVSVAGLEEGGGLAYLWLVATAYDDAGQVVGLRRWEAPVEALGDSVEFNFMVYSTGRPIDWVEVLAEARALGE